MPLLLEFQITTNEKQQNGSHIMSINLSFCKGVRSLADNFKDLANGIQYNSLCSFFLIFLYQYKSISDFVRSTPGSLSVSSLSEAVKDFDGNRFMRRLRSKILRQHNGKLNSKDFCFAIDDTDNPKCGKKFYNVGNWKSSKGIYFGQRIVVLVLVDIKNGYAIPLDYRFAIKKESSNYKSVLDLSIEMLSAILNSGFLQLPMAADSWFDSSSFMNKLDGLGIPFIIEIKSNRNAHTTRGTFWKKITDLFMDIKKQRLPVVLTNRTKKYGNKVKWFCQRNLFITKYNKSLNIIAVYNRKNGRSPFALYGTSLLSMTGAQLWGYSRARWKIECMFRDLKQNLSFGKLGCGGKEGADLAICIPFIIYTSLLLDSDKIWELSKRSIGSMIGILKQREMDKTIKIFLFDNGSKEEKLTRLKARRQIEQINKKPINRLAEDLFPNEHLAA